MSDELNIIDDKDIDKVNLIAKKYSMTLKDFGRLLSKKKGEKIRHQIRYNSVEIDMIDKRAEELSMTRSEYIRRCYMKAIDDKLYLNMDIKELKRNTYKDTGRDVRVALSFNDADDYKKMRKVAKDYSLKFSTLIRYFSLSVEL